MTWVEWFRVVTGSAGVVAFGLLTWRLVTSWLALPPPARMLGVLLAASVLIGALFTVQLAQMHSPFVPAGWLVLVHRLTVIGVCVFWWHPRTGGRPRVAWHGTAHSR